MLALLQVAPCAYFLLDAVVFGDLSSEVFQCPFVIACSIRCFLNWSFVLLRVGSVSRKLSFVLRGGQNINSVGSFLRLRAQILKALAVALTNHQKNSRTVNMSI